MEKLRYPEARAWFWTRTWLWMLPMLAASAAVWYVLMGEFPLLKSPRMWLSLGAGVTTVLCGLLAAALSMQLPWMRLGWKLAFVPNGVVCAAAGGLAAFLVGGVVLSFMKNDPVGGPSQAAIDAAFTLIQYGIGVGAFWGFIIGSWFAMRRDRYFVEQV